jgi:hypothetical protein
LTPASGLTVWQAGQLTVTGFEVVPVLIVVSRGASRGGRSTYSTA